jgi:Flp pilus assembly protein TadD
MLESRRHDGGTGAAVAASPVRPTNYSEADPALALVQGDNSMNALEHYREAARLNSTDPQVLKDLADYLLVGAGKPEEAFETYQRVLLIMPDDPETLQVLGNLSVSLRRFTEARGYYGRLVATQPWNVSAKKSLASLQSFQPVDGPLPPKDEFREAITDLQKTCNGLDEHQIHDKLDRLVALKEETVRRQSPPKRSVSYADIQKYIAAEEIDKAIAGLEQYVAASPDHAVAHNDLGVLYYRVGQKAKALEHYRRAVELDGDNAVFRKNLADHLYVEEADVEGAAREYIHVLRGQPKDVEALIAFGHICTDLGKPADAEFFFNKVIDIQPWNVTARHSIDALKKNSIAGVEDGSPESEYRAIRQLVQVGSTGAALQALRQYVIRSPQHAAAQNDLAVLSYHAGNKADALRGYEAAARLEPTNATYQMNLADYLFVEEHRDEDALRIYVNVLKANPRDIEVLLGIARICEILGRLEDARVFYGRVLEWEPANITARQALEKLPRSQGN